MAITYPFHEFPGITRLFIEPYSEKVHKIELPYILTYMYYHCPGLCDAFEKYM